MAVFKPIGANPNVADGGDASLGNNLPIDEILRLVEQEYGDIDDIFSVNPELQQLLIDAFEGKWQPQRFYNAVTTTDWFKQTAQKLQQRGFYKRIYDNLTKDITKDDPDRKSKIQKAAGSTEYFRGLTSFEATLEKNLIAKGIDYTPDQLSAWAEELYNTGYEDDKDFIGRFLNRKITYTPGGAAKGGALDNLTILREYANDMGLNLDTDFASSLSDWLQKLDAGESVQYFKDLIRDQVAATEPEIADLIKRGMTVKDIYQPYRQLMASTLEVGQDTIKLDDPALRKAIRADGRMNLYDFKKSLRRDTRWEFTQAARDDVFANVYKVLRDFGFQG